MQREDHQNEVLFAEKRFIELSRLAYQRDYPVYSDFLNLNELNILYTLPKEELYTQYLTFGGYESAERQIAAFLPDALYLRWRENPVLIAQSFPYVVLEISPLYPKYAEPLTHRDFLGAILNLGIDRCKIGDILLDNSRAVVFVQEKMAEFLGDELTRVRHTAVQVSRKNQADFTYEPQYEERKGTVASVRLDSLLSLAFSSSRTQLSSLIEGAKVFVNGKLITSNGYQPKEGDIISVRGMGKFQYMGILSRTKKGRLYILVRKYM